jgi:acetylornithine deacetylase/succinyl-diaminopimelate desuccinylase-like protein
MTDPELQLLLDVLAIDSTWGHERELAGFIAEKMRSWGVDEVELVESMPGRPSVAGRIRGTGGGPRIRSVRWSRTAGSTGPASRT